MVNHQLVTGELSQSERSERVGCSKHISILSGTPSVVSLWSLSALPATGSPRWDRSTTRYRAAVAPIRQADRSRPMQQIPTNPQPLWGAASCL